MSKNVMVDLETMGNTPGCAIVSIGAVVFDEKGLGAEFYRTIDLEDAVKRGLHLDPSTVKWWVDQNPEALKQAMKGEYSLERALVDFGEWLNEPSRVGSAIWGNGSDFDNVLLAAAYAAIGKELPWKFYMNKCYRTLKGFFPKNKLVRVGTFHNALDDAKSQASHAIELLAKINQPAIPVQFIGELEKMIEMDTEHGLDQRAGELRGMIDRLTKL